jgi:hypothetical protein
VLRQTQGFVVGDDERVRSDPASGIVKSFHCSYLSDREEKYLEILHACTCILYLVYILSMSPVRSTS